MKSPLAALRRAPAEPEPIAPEAEVLAACQVADEAARALATALERRRAAIAAVARAGGHTRHMHGLWMKALGRRAADAAMIAAGVGPHLGLLHVVKNAQQTFAEQARHLFRQQPPKEAHDEALP